MTRKFTALSLMLLMLIGMAFAAQTVLSIQPLKENNYNVQVGDLAITFTACDAVNGNAYTATGHEILIVQNSDGTAAHTFTISSVPDPLGRSDTSLTNYNVPISAFAAIYTTTQTGWKQNTGQIFLACSSNLLKFAVVQTQH